MSLKIGDTIIVRKAQSHPCFTLRNLGWMPAFDLLTIENDKQLAKYSAMLGSKSVQAKTGR